MSPYGVNGPGLEPRAEALPMSPLARLGHEQIAQLRAEARAERLAAPPPEVTDPMNATHIDVSVPAFGGSVRLRSASGGLEALWIDVRDESGATVAYDRATGRHLAAAVRLTPNDARALAALLNRYADTHAETSDD